MAKTKKAAPPAREPTPSSGSDSESDYSSDDTVEDEDGAELTPAMDAAILRTLSKIRRGEGVYSGENILAAELAAAQALAQKRGLSARAAKEEAKPFLLKDLHRANLLAGVTEEEETHEAVPLTNVEMERRARQEALSAFQSFGADSDDEDEDDADAGGLLVKRTRDEEEDEEEDAAYRAFLLEMGGGEKEVRKTLGMADAPNTHYREESDSDADDEAKPKADKKKGKKGKESADDKTQHHAERFEKRKQADEDFLMDYILNRGWIDKSDKHVPTYDEIVGRRFKKGEDEEEQASSDDDDDEGATEHPWGVLDEEDEFDERADEFETQYNFRFEEPGSSTIITHPRTIPSLVRREDDSRKLKREARAERKAAEKAAREDETRRLKGEKRREMEGQLAALKKELGEDGVDWTGVEKVLEGEWDEDEWDRVVGALLEAKAAEDDDKPTWDDDIGDYGDDDDGWVEPVPWEEAEGAYEDEDEDGPINMDADFIGFEPKKLSKKEKRDKKRKRGDADADAEASTSASASLTVAERAAAMKAAADELRGLDHEDVVGDLPTRFKYTRSAPASFGLTPAEILLATDAELNALVSVKHIAPYRRHGLGAIGRGLGKRVRDLKTQLRARKWGDDVEENPKGPAPRAPGGKGANAIALGPRGEEGKDKRNGKRLGKKQRQKLRAAEAEGEGGASEPPAPSTDAAPVPGKRKRDDEASVATAPDEGEGKKRRRKKKKAKGDAAEAE